MGNQPDQQASSVDTLLDSALQSVEEAESLVLKVARAAGFPEEELYKLNMAVRETVVNAVVHGNRYSAHKKVHFQVSGSKDRITVTVGDEGNGFDLASLPDPLAEENLLHQSGRGLLLVRAFVDEFQVRRLTPRGTQVELVKRLTHES
ncbi:MAG: ATP-binding protein [Acidobacteriales bacterium]|jgi:serine/threonine-protein kinase RsbW|nr:MAG: ATP-binding protein [Terriglobales bacterium]